MELRKVTTDKFRSYFQKEVHFLCLIHEEYVSEVNSHFTGDPNITWYSCYDFWTNPQMIASSVS